MTGNPRGSSMSEIFDPNAWIYDDSQIADPFGYGERAVRFLRGLRHPKSNAPGNAFQLDKWQERIVRRIYGPRYTEDVFTNGVLEFRRGDRIVRTVAMMLPRGNRKTSLGAALALLHTIGPENLPRGECMVAASDRSQARIAFLEAMSIIDAEERLTGKLKKVDSKNRISNPKTGAFFEALSADGKVAHGHTPVFALADELHAWPKRDLWEAIKTGLVKVPNSLMMVISTAGRGQENVAWDFFDRARKVARGEISDPSLLPILFETPRDADWQDETLWFAANPGLRFGYPDIGGLRQLAREARDVPAERAMFQQLNLNMWLDGSADPFVDMMVYDEGAFPVDIDDLDGEPCWLGVDLSSVNDLTAVVTAWKDGDDGYIVHPWFFCPEDNLRARSDRDKVPYVEWAEAEHIIPTPGNVVDFRFVEDHKRVQRKTANQRLKTREKKLTIEKIEEDNTAIICAAIAGWTWGGDAKWNGKKPEFTPENVAEVMAVDWIRKQVKIALDEEADFFTT
ncbi:terminase large subunit [Shinella sp.]|uniref:terminase large subunit n=1 Tax=Shinella sp. TaxID=1870904 RepID=UPI0029B67772|nr:terminase large subunit [Shinella sp.]MDX3975795.1 terminase large subunit [Shinella sp.]